MRREVWKIEAFINCVTVLILYPTYTISKFSLINKVLKIKNDTKQDLIVFIT